MSIIRDLTGQKFGMMTVIGKGESRPRPDGKGTMLHWLCRCDCGQHRQVETQNLRRRKPSCGCDRTRKITEKTRKHGHASGGKVSPELRTWIRMRKRSSNPNAKDAKYYKGIGVCQRWLDSFANFFEDMGPRPSPSHSIDRIDGSKGYEPGNCRWATKKEQSINRRNVTMVTIDGETKCLADWARHFGINSKLVYHRISYGMSIEKALQPINHKTGEPLDH